MRSGLSGHVSMRFASVLPCGWRGGVVARAGAVYDRDIHVEDLLVTILVLVRRGHLPSYFYGTDAYIPSFLYQVASLSLNSIISFVPSEVRRVLARWSDSLL